MRMQDHITSKESHVITPKEEELYVIRPQLFDPQPSTSSIMDTSTARMNTEHKIKSRSVESSVKHSSPTSSVCDNETRKRNPQSNDMKNHEQINTRKRRLVCDTCGRLF